MPSQSRQRPGKQHGHGKQQQQQQQQQSSSSSSSQSKPKEEIDAANLAVKRRNDSQERESQSQTQKQAAMESKKTLKCSDWSQTPTQVVVTLFAGKKLTSNDITVDFTKDEVDISLTDGRRWHCKLNCLIRQEMSRAQLSKLKVILRLKKLVEGQTWTSLETNSDEENDENVPQQQQQPRQGVSIAQSTRSSESRNIPITTTEQKARKTSPARNNLLGNKSQSSPNVNMETSTTPNTGVTSQSESLASSEAPSTSLSEDAHEPGTTSDLHQNDENEKSVEDVKDSEKHQDPAAVSMSEEDDITATEEPVIELNHVKHDWYEMGNCDSLSVQIFIKHIDKASLKVTFEERNVAVTFKTTDRKFLSLHEGTTSDTIFSWKVTVVDNLVAEKCKYRVGISSVELTLKKQEARRWIALEASQDRGSHTASTSWLPAPTKTVKVTPTPDQTKVIFDEMNTEISNIRPAGSATDADWSLLEGTRESGASSKAPLQRGNILGDSNKENTQILKPTCMVSPISKQDHADKPQVVSPGMTGLNNLGNTCFMNSVLQVLLNTCELRDYFLDRQFQNDLNIENPLGMGGRLATEFAILTRILWSGKHYHFAPSKLKNLIGSRWTQFTGFAQHDAQEFMAFLLDGLHEDLNRIVEKPYVESKDSDGRPDEVVADEAWAQYKKRNDSFIVDLFQGQYKSKLVCPVCSKVSITFDPFMHLSVPMPKKQTLLLVIFMSKDPL